MHCKIEIDKMAEPLQFNLCARRKMVELILTSESLKSGQADKGRQLIKLLIDITGIIQIELDASQLHRHAAVISDIRALIGQTFSISVIEMNAPEQKLYIARQIRQLQTIAFGS